MRSLAAHEFSPWAHQVEGNRCSFTSQNEMMGEVLSAVARLAIRGRQLLVAQSTHSASVARTAAGREENRTEILVSRDVRNRVTAMPLAIDANSHEPAYLQIVRQIRRLIASGSLKPGDALPSARVIARTLTVNPMTASKAIQRLADEGVLARRRGMTMTVVALSQPELVPGGVVEAEVMSVSVQRVTL